MINNAIFVCLAIDRIYSFYFLNCGGTVNMKKSRVRPSRTQRKTRGNFSLCSKIANKGVPWGIFLTTTTTLELIKRFINIILAKQNTQSCNKQNFQLKSCLFNQLSKYYHFAINKTLYFVLSLGNIKYQNAKMWMSKC